MAVTKSGAIEKFRRPDAAGMILPSVEADA
jgi:hypothetical protein